MGQLFVVPTPIGNLDDITFRAVKILKKVSLIAAEDTRVTRKLLKHFEIHTPMTSFYEHNELVKLEVVFGALKTGDVALVSDAGTPGISDPGFVLIREALQRGVKVVPLPGPTALIPALIGSGMPTDRFIYLGFLSKKSGPRREQFKSVAEERGTVVFYESAFRLGETLQDALQVLGDRNICVVREVSKLFEEFTRTTLLQASSFYKMNQVAGEIVVVVEGEDKDKVSWNKDKVVLALQHEMDRGVSLSQVAKIVAQESGWKKTEVYQLGLTLRQEEEIDEN